MKRIFVFLVPVAMIIGAIMLLNTEVYVGNVIGDVKVSNPYRYGNYGPYNYVDISFEYKTPDSKMYSEVLTREDKYFLQNTTKGKLLSQGKVYKTPWWFLLIGILLITGAIGIIIALIIFWICFSEERYCYRMPRERMNCHGCSVENLCYFVNTQFNIPTKPIKNFFGY